MVTFITVIHVCLCLFLIVVVLLQTGKGADMGAAFGGASQTVFGATGALTLLHKVTTVTAVLFMLTSLSLAWHSARVQSGGGGLDGDIFDIEKERAEQKEAEETGETVPAEGEGTELEAPVEEEAPAEADEADEADGGPAPGAEAPAEEEQPAAE